ncbi:MAG TPA: Gfo/Idh/MocA family oxidoreductase, partial [Tepidisphaeraceae bacterium]|nr:Gfo/Idh/MocA family oxidoreductase [Tepidisphaeraceae bacterium]
MRKVRFGLIGFGAWGSHHARAIAQNPAAELCAISARSAPSQQKAREAHPSAKVYDSHRALLDDADVEAVAVVLPTDLHFEVGSVVLESGRHLLLEKPMALALEHCDKLNELARKRERLLAIGHEFRLSSLWGRVKQMIDAGDIGEPQYALIELWRRPYRLGADGWRYDINRVGNWILEEPIHFFDLARWYFQRTGDPISVFAQANAKRPDHPELQDNFIAMLRFPGGAYAVIAQTLAAWEHHQVVKVTGREGALWASWSGAIDRTFKPTFSLRHQRGDQLVDIPITKMTGEVYELAEQVGHFARAITEGERLTTTGEDGRWSVAMCLKAQESV